MEASGWRPAQGDTGMASGDWRSELSTESRQRIVNKIMEILKKHLPISGPEGLSELKKIAVRFEEKIYAAATSQPDYLRKISLKMLTMESKSSNTNPLASNSAAGIQNSQDPALHGMQQVRNPGQPLPISLPGQAQARQPILSQNVQNPVTSGNIQSTSNMSAALPSITGTTGTSLPGALSQGSTLSSMSGIPQNSVNSSTGQAVPTHIFSNAQRQVQARQQSQQVASQQHQQQPQNQQFYHQHLQQQMSKSKMQQQGNIQSSLLKQPQMQQHQPQLQPNQMQPSQPLIQISQQPSLQPSQVSLQQPQASVLQTAQPSGLQHGQQQSLSQTVSPVIQQHQQSMLRLQQSQQSSVQQHPSVTHQHQPQMNQASVLSSQQQQLMGQTNSSGIQQNQMLGQQNTVPDLQQQQQRMFSQQNLSNMQQQQQQQQQQLLGQQGNIPTMHQQSQKLGQQGSISGLQQHSQLLGSQSSTSSLQQHSHPMHQILQHSKPSIQHQQSQQTSSSLLQQQPQQSQTQPLQQQMIAQIQNPSTQLQQQMTMQQQPNNLQRELQKRVQTSGGLLQQPGVIDQQKPQFQSQRVLPEASSASMETTPQPTHATTIDWQEEVYQKIKALKDLYFDELDDLYQKLTLKCQQQDALVQTQMQSEQIDKLRNYRNVLKTTLTYLTIPKNSISPGFKDKIGSFKTQILYILNLFKARKPTQNQQGQQQQLPPPSSGQSLSVQQQQQLPPQSGGQSLSLQQQQTQPQISQLQHNESRANQLQSVNLQNSVNSMQSSTMATMQHGSMPLGQNTGIPSSQQNLRNVLQSGSHMDSTQSSNLGTLQPNAVNSFSQGGGGSLQQNTVNSSSQSTLSSLPQSSMNTMQQTNVNTQANVNILQHQQQLKQMQQRHMQQQMIQKQHKQQIMQQTQLQQQYQQQQLHMHQKQQQSPQLQAHQMTQLYQMNDFNELKIKPGVGLKAGLLQQQHSMGQRASFQQLKTGSSFSVSSPQLPQTTSPQISQHSSSQVDQQSLLTVTSAPKVGTPMQAATSPFVVPSPSTPFSQSPLPGDNEKPGTSPLSNTGNTVNQQSTALSAQAQSLAIGTPGISLSPLLAEFTTHDGNLGGTAALGSSSKSSTNERPFDRLMKAVSSVSSRAFTSSINDITAVMNLADRMVGSAPGNGARTAVGEDLAATTRCRVQARSLVAQDGNAASRKMKRSTSAMPLNVVSSAGSVNNSLHLPTGVESSELESTATSGVKKQKTEVNQILLDEIKDINEKLIGTIIDVSDEDNDLSSATAEGRGGIVIRCSYNAVALSQNMKSQYALAQISPILPLKLLIPWNYPKTSPILLDIQPVDLSVEGDDLSAKAQAKFNLSVLGLQQPMSLGEMARTWDDCARKVMEEYAQQTGGGSFSSRYGAWENWVSA